MTQTENTMSNSNNNGEGATPLHFCPIDQNLLHVTNTPYPDPNSMPAHMAEQEQRYTRHGQRLYRWYCLTCNYTYPINTAVRIEVELTPKEVDDVLGGEGAWKYAAVEKNVHCEREGCTNKGTFFCGRRSSFVVRRSWFARSIDNLYPVSSLRSRALGLTTRTHALSRRVLAQVRISGRCRRVRRTRRRRCTSGARRAVISGCTAGDGGGVLVAKRRTCNSKTARDTTAL